MGDSAIPEIQMGTGFNAVRKFVDFLKIIYHLFRLQIYRELRARDANSGINL